MPRMPRPSARSLAYLLLFGATIAVGTELARPFRSASIAFDSQAAVLYFERIVSGVRLEAFVPTTPKPLLTLIFGALYSTTHDWRSLAWMTIGTEAVAVVLAAALAHRIGGAIAATFVGVSLATSASLLNDVGYSLATPYALVGWVAAGLAITAPRPRYAIAGIALALATLARVETIVVVGFALAAVAAARWAPAKWGIPMAPRGAWLVPVLGLLALPVMLLHDLVLTGDPLYWLGVASRHSAEVQFHIRTPVEVGIWLVSRYWAMGAVLLLAGVGAARLLAERRHSLMIGLIGLGPGIAVLLILLAAQGTIVDHRYAAPIDVAAVFIAGLGIGRVHVRTLAWPPLHHAAARARARFGQGATVAAFAVVSILLVGPYWHASPTLRQRVRNNLHLAVNADRAVVPLAAALKALDAQGDPGVLVLAPTGVLPRLAVELGLGLLDIRSTDTAKLSVAGGYPAAGQLLFHSRPGDRASAGWSEFEIDAPRQIGPVTLDPLLVDQESGLWVIAVR